MHLCTRKYMYGAAVTCRYHSSGMTSRYASVKRAGTKGGKETSRRIAAKIREQQRIEEISSRFLRGRTAERFCLYPVGYNPRLYIDFTFGRSLVVKTQIIRVRREPEARIIFFDKRPGGNFGLTYHRGRFREFLYFISVLYTIMLWYNSFLLRRAILRKIKNVRSFSIV